MQTQTKPSAKKTQKMAFHKSMVGRVPFALLPKVFSKLKKGRKVQKHNYKFRVDFKKLVTAISFLQESLLIKPSIARDFALAGDFSMTCLCTKGVVNRTSV